MPLTPGTKVKVRETFPHDADGNPGTAEHKADRLVRGKVGTVIRRDRMYDNVVNFDNPEGDDDWGYFYDHELEVI